MANGFATREMTGTNPNTRSETGAIPNCAANVAAKTPRVPTMRPIPADTHASPTVAPTLSAKPTLHANIGSTSSNTMTARDNTTRALAGDFNNPLLATIAAMNAARNTEGSARVSTTNHTSNNIVMHHFIHRLRRFSNGDTTINR
jgi:hypothetical protein